MPNHKPLNTKKARIERAQKATPDGLVRKRRMPRHKKLARRLSARRLLMRQQRKLELAAGNLGSMMPQFVVRSLIQHVAATCPDFGTYMRFTDKAKMRVGEITGAVLDELLHHCARTMKAAERPVLRSDLVYTVAQTAGLTPLCHVISGDTSETRQPEWLDRSGPNTYPPWLGADFYTKLYVELPDVAAAVLADETK